MRGRVCIVSGEVSTAFGHGSGKCFEALLEGRSSLRPVRRFEMPRSRFHSGATMSALDRVPKKKIMDAFLDMLSSEACKFTSDTELFLACTVGDIEHLYNPENRCTAELMLEAGLKRYSFKSGRIISAACASANTAIERASSMIAHGMLDSAFIISADHLSEFLFSGFSALKAMSYSCVRPYDNGRDGLLLGDAAGCVGLCSEAYASSHQLSVLGSIESGALTCDAFHITAPMTGGARLAAAIETALARASLKPSDIGCVIGHGTGTRLNDSMEIEVMKRVFPHGVPLVSVKGSCGHTLAGSGVLQTAVALKILETCVIPPQTFLETPLDGASDYVSCFRRSLEKKHIVTMNSGFGGVNAVVIIGEAS